MKAHAVKTSGLASKMFYFLMSSVGTFLLEKYTAHLQYANIICFMQFVMPVINDIWQQVNEVHVFLGNACSMLLH